MCRSSGPSYLTDMLHRPRREDLAIMMTVGMTIVRSIVRFTMKTTAGTTTAGTTTVRVMKTSTATAAKMPRYCPESRGRPREADSERDASSRGEAASSDAAAVSRKFLGEPKIMLDQSHQLIDNTHGLHRTTAGIRRQMMMDGIHLSIHLLRLSV